MNIGMVLLLLPSILKVVQSVQSILKGQASSEDWLRTIQEIIALIERIPGVGEIFQKIKPFIDGLRALLLSKEEMNKLSVEDQRAAQNLVTLFDETVKEMISTGTAARKTVDGLTMEELVKEATEE